MVFMNSRTSYNEFVNKACNMLGITPLGKTFHYTSKYDNMKLIWLQDDQGLGLMCYFNNDIVDVYVCEFPHAMSPNVISTR